MLVGVETHDGGKAVADATSATCVGGFGGWGANQVTPNPTTTIIEMIIMSAIFMMKFLFSGIGPVCGRLPDVG